MKHFLLLSVLFLGLLILPVTALNTSYGLQDPGYSGPMYVGDTITVASGTSICAISGRTPWTGYAAKGGLAYQTNILFNGNFLYWMWIAPYTYATATPFTYTVVTAATGYNITETAICAPEGSEFGGRYWNFVSGARPTNVTVNFTISDSLDASFLSNVTITVSSGVFGLTNPSGVKALKIEPIGILYNYSLVKEGYDTKVDQALGAYGLTGGNLNATMVKTIDYIPPGYMKTTVHTIDALTGGQIRGTTIEIKDVENGSWVNSTADADGQLDIIAMTTHHLDIYGSYPTVYSPSQELGAGIGIADYNLPMYPILPPAPPGYVNVMVYVKDAVTDFSISGAKVDFRNSSLVVESRLTDTYGAVLTTWKNNSVITFTTGKTEYNAQTESHVTPHFLDVLYTVRLSKPGLPSPTVVPTDAIGNPITAVPTYLQFCNPAAPDYDPIDCGRSQDNDLMKQLRDNGSPIVSLAILAIIFGLLKMIFKF